MFQIIQNDERGVMYKNGAYAGLLMPGKHFTLNQVVIFKLGHYFNSSQDIKMLLENKELAEQLISFDIHDDQAAIYTIDGNFSSIISRAGTYAVWKGPWKQEILYYDITEPLIEDKQLIKWCRKGFLNNDTNAQVVSSGFMGMLYIDQRPVKVVEPGTYFVWRGSKPVHIVSCDIRQQTIELAGQELVSNDKIMLRINFSATYQITDIEKALHNSSNYQSQIYNIMQLALRAYIGGYSLEDIFNKKDEISNAILANVQDSCNAIGIKLVSAGIKDIILPGEIKDILNQVLIAEKQAQANVITRREETASMRNMLNTAKLMEDNKMLFRLREMEHIERIVSNIDSIELTSKENIIDQLRNIAGKQEDK